MLHIYGNYHSSLNSYDKEQQTSRSNHQLYRYNHEPVSSNLLRRDIPPILILLFFLFLIVITLSQILVVHTSRYGANFSTMQKIQEELKLMDDSMEALLRDNVLPIDKWRLLFHIQTYLYRFESLFDLFNNDSNLITNQSLSQTITNINIKQLLKPLLNKSNEFLLRENTSDYLMNNIKHVQDRLKTMINEKDYSEWKRRRTKNNYKRQRNYCPEEPRYLRKFEKKYGFHEFRSKKFFVPDVRPGSTFTSLILVKSLIFVNNCHIS
jgi:hypothetical protein